MSDNTDQTYNGWSNYQTWAVALWIDNDRSTYEHAREMADDALDQSRRLFQGRVNVARRILADALQEMVEEAAPDLDASMFSDLLGHAIGAVDWYEMAGNILSEMAPDAA